MTDQPVEKPHYSPSQAESFARCPEAYRRRYLDGDRIPPGIRAISGKGVHGGAQINFSQKIKSHVDMTLDDIIDAAVYVYESEIETQNVVLNRDELSRGVKRVLAEAKDETARLASAHAKLQAPEYQPVHVEREHRIIIPGSTHDLLGIIDMEDDRDIVTDWKMSSKRFTEQDVASSVQLTYYAAAHHIHTGRPAREVRLDAIIKNKEPVRQVIAARRSTPDYIALKNRLNAQLAAIAAGNFPPASTGSWWCSPKWCGYYSTCPYVNAKPVIVDLNLGTAKPADPTPAMAIIESPPPNATVLPPLEDEDSDDVQSSIDQTAPNELAVAASTGQP